ncbi:MAG: MBL fold metallo-hydrolase [Oscillospiraceae bacterium]|nr:MBL fold metallo-hydrolase [Oscillospiraceae bacterium]
MDWNRINDSTYSYEDGGVRFFLLTGSEYALLIDSGMNVRNVKELARQVTSLPLKLFNTHADPDHTGCNDEFDEVMMNPAEFVNYKKPHPSQRMIPIYDGDILDPGGRPLRAIALPGHTPGSTALLDINSGMLFPGDPVQDGHIFIFGEMRDLSAYILSLRRLQTFTDSISAVYPCHGTCPVSPEITEKLIEGAERVERGEAEFTTAEVFGHRIRKYDIGAAVLLADDSPEK